MPREARALDAHREFTDAREHREFSEILDRLTKTHKFSLSGEDRVGIAKVYTAFFDGGPLMDYRFNNSDRVPSQGATYTW